MKYDLVFEGGGAKGMIFVGAYEVFTAQGHTPGRLLGTSAGAITAALVAAGYSSEELLAALNERENGKSVFAGFMGDPLPFSKEEIQASAIRSLLRNINFTFAPGFVENRIDDGIAETLAQQAQSRHFFAFVERGGWYSAQRFLTWMRNKLDSGTWQGQPRRFSAMTLEQFHAVTQVDLSVIASDETGGRMLVLNHRTAPQCPLLWAVRMSMSIPLVWDEVIWQPSWGNYLRRDISNHAIVDGGMLSNFPLELSISDESYVTQCMGPKQDNAILGLLIDDALPVPQPTASRGFLVDVNVKPAELQTSKRLLRLLNTMMVAHDKLVMDAFSDLVVHLPAGGYGVTEFDMSDERRNTLVDAGRTAMSEYFARPSPAAIPNELEAYEQESAKAAANRIALNILQP